MATFYDQNVLVNTPAAYWRLDETSGTAAADLSGNALTGTYTGGFTLNQTVLPGDGGTAVLLNGSTGYVTRAAHATLGGIVATWTVEAWIRIANSDTIAGIISQAFSSSYPWILGINVPNNSAANKVHCNFYNGAWAYATHDTALSVGTTYHLMGTWDGLRLCLYVNGVLVAAGSPAIAPASQGNVDVYIGRDGTPNYFDGYIARAAIYATALTDQDARRHYNAMANAPATGGMVGTTEYIRAGATIAFTLIGNGTTWTNGTSPISVTAGTINSQTVDATKQTVAINYTAGADPGYVTFTDAGTASFRMHIPGAPSGVVAVAGDLLGTDLSFSNDGFNCTYAANGTLTDYCVVDAASTGYIGHYIFGGTITPTAIRIAPRATTNDGSIFEQFMWGMVVKGSNASPTTFLTTIRTLAATDFHSRRWQYREFSLPDMGAFQYIVLTSATNGYLGIADFEIVCPYVTFLQCRPLEPTISPSGGRWDNFLTRTVTLASATTQGSASSSQYKILYTTDGTTPTHTLGVPTGTTIAYAGPFTVTPTVSGVTIKALTYDVRCTTTDSYVTTSGPFLKAGYPIKERQYNITNGRTVEAHACCIVTPAESGDGYYYRFGHFSDCSNTGNDPGVLAIFCYRSVDLMNWEEVGQMVDGVSRGIGTGSGLVRPSVFYNTASAKWVMWAKVYTAVSKVAYWTADNVYGPYTNIADNQQPAGWTGSRAYDGFSDFSMFKDTDGQRYVIASAYVGATGYIIIQKVDMTDGMGCTTGAGDGYEFGFGALTREGCVLFKQGANYFIITSCTNYYDSAGATMDVRYILGTGGTTPLNTSWGAMDGTLLPGLGGSVAGDTYNAQPTCVVSVAGQNILMLDWWTQAYNYDSYDLWLPIVFTSTTAPSVGIGGASGGVTPPGESSGSIFPWRGSRRPSRANRSSF